MKETPSIYNPLDKRNLGESVAEALLNSPIHKLPPDTFVGAGVYAIYYTGELPVYQKLAEINRDGRFECPIYVGKAVPAGARKGGMGSDVAHGKVLSSRLGQHAESIKATENLSIDDFYCRYLVVDDIWIPLAESMLIERFQPVWNCVLDGFGNHDPGKGRYAGMKPQWDCMHPGRIWADKLQPCVNAKEELQEKVIQYLSERIK